MYFFFIYTFVNFAVAVRPESALSSGDLSPITLRAEFGENYFARIPADFIDARNQSHRGIIRMDFSNEPQPRGVVSTTWNDISYRSVSFGDDSVRLDLENFASDAINPFMIMQMGPQSPLISTATNSAGYGPRGYIIAPISDEAADFVINPSNPREYALGGEIFYAPRNPENQAFWIVPAAVRLVNNESEQSSSPNESDLTFCAVFDRALQLINPTRMVQYPTVPDRIFQQVLSRLSALGVSLIHRGPRLLNFDESMYDNLPSIQFIMETDDERLISLAVIEPREYIGHTFAGRYALRLRTSNPTNQDCTLTRSILEKLVIHLDIDNTRIGFGEPLIEL